MNESNSKIYAPPPAAVNGAHVSGMAAYQKLVDEADADYSGYWARLAREFVTWKTPFTRALDASEAPFYKWFEDGTLNVSYNCLDRNVLAGKGAKTAILFEADDGTVTAVTYDELLARMLRPSQFKFGRAPDVPGSFRMVTGTKPSVGWDEVQTR